MQLGSHCILVSYNGFIHPSGDFNAKHVQIQYKSEICRKTDEECYVYICNIIAYSNTV